MSPPPGEERLFSGEAGRLLAVLAAGSLVGMTSRLLLSPLLPAIMDDLALSPFLAGIALSAMWASSALAQYPGGRAADALSRKSVVIAAFGLVLLGVILLARVQVYFGFLAGVITVGLGAGLATPATLAMIADHYHARRGQAFSINTAALNLGGIMAAGMATATLAVATWESAFLPLIGFLIVVIVGVLRWSDESIVLSPVTLDVGDTVTRLVGTPSIRLMIVTVALFEFTWQSTASFLPTYLQAEKGASLFLANNVFAGVFAIGVIANPIVGKVGDRFGHLRLAFMTSALATIGLAVVLLADSTAVLLTGVVFFAIGLTGFWPVMLTALMTAFPNERMGGDLGATRSVYVGIGSLGSVYVGYIAGIESYTIAFSGLFALLLICTAITYWLASTER